MRSCLGSQNWLMYFCLLLLGSHREDGRAAQAGGVDGHADAGVTPGQLLGEDQRAHQVDAAAAVLLGKAAGGVEPEVVGLLHDGPRRLLLLVVLGGDRAHLVDRELVGELADLLLLLREAEVESHLLIPSGVEAGRSPGRW